jgi:hypothetical protein
MTGQEEFAALLVDNSDDVLVALVKYHEVP